MLDFHLGQKVVCIYDEPTDEGISRDKGVSAGTSYPVKGRIYTVRDAYVSRYGVVGLLLCELDNSAASSKLGYASEIGFDAGRFRPVVDRATDISVFTAMLNTKKEPAHA